MPDILRRPPPPDIQSFRTPRSYRLIAGSGARHGIGALLEELGAARAILITGRSLARTTLPDEIAAGAGGRIVARFDRMRAHTPMADLLEALALARDARADAVVSFGGGAVMDAGKYAAACLGLGLHDAGAIRAYLAAQTATPPPIAAMPAHVCIPTTASAAEFTKVAGVLDEEAGTKRRIDHPQIVPDAIVQDSETVLATPPDLWLSSAVRSLDHAVEALYGPRANAWTDGLAQEAIRRLARGLPAFRRDPSNRDAIADIQAATWTAASAGNGAGTGLSHGIGYLMGAGFGLPHGHCSCVTLAHVAEWMRPAAAPALARAARAMGAAGDGTAEDAAAEALGPAIRALVEGLGQPVRARDTIVPSRAALEALAPKVLTLPHVPISPRRPRDEAEAAALLAAMW